MRSAADQKAVGCQEVEELICGGGAGRCAAHGFAQLLPHRALSPSAFGFVALGAGGAFGRGAVAGGHAV